MKTLAFSLLAIATLAVGCMGVPRTQIKFNPATRELSIKSPKDVLITNLVATITTNGTSISIGSYASQNNAAVIDTIAKANAANISAIATAGQNLIDKAATVAK